MEQTNKRKMLIKVAKMYYYGHMTQQEISTTLQISRPKVSRMLREAEDLGIVKFTINDSTFNYEDAENALMKHLSLKYVKIVPSTGVQDHVKQRIGVAASELLNRHLRDGSVIGISWGTTVNAFVNAYQAVKPSRNSVIVQLVGGMYSRSMHMDGRELARILAEKLHCSYSALQTPMYVHSTELKALLMEEPEAKRHFELMDRLDIAFIGIGSSNYKESVVYKAQYIEEEAAKNLYANGLCDICGHQISEDGYEPENFFSRRLIGISLESLRKTPLTVGICAGNNKSKSIRSAVNGGYIRALVIDEIAAISLLEDMGIKL